MAHYAFLDKDNFVDEVIVGIDETEFIEGLNPEVWYANFKGKKCLRTSYNGNIRKNFAGLGYFYDEVKDAFIAPKPDEAIGFDEETCQWIIPEYEALPI
jgi:hypothetical protein